MKCKYTRSSGKTLGVAPLTPTTAFLIFQMNAQGGFAAPDDDDLQNDWLDVMFTVMRGVFLLSIIYFYSNFYRILGILLLSVIIYM